MKISKFNIAAIFKKISDFTEKIPYKNNEGPLPEQPSPPSSVI